MQTEHLPCFNPFISKHLFKHKAFIQSFYLYFKNFASKQVYSDKFFEALNIGLVIKLSLTTDYLLFNNQLLFMISADIILSQNKYEAAHAIYILLHCQEANAQARLRICAVLPESSLLAHTKC